MKGDFSRRTFDRKKHYSEVRWQQGRVNLDAEINEYVEMQSYLRNTEARDVIGLCGAPETCGGFEVGMPVEGYDLLGVHFVDSKRGWAAVKNGSIVATTDGGRTWKTQKSGIEVAMTAIHFLNSHIGYAVGENGLIFYTLNGGDVWNVPYAVPPDQQHLCGVCFLDEPNGVVVGLNSTIWYTHDGGKTWKKAKIKDTQAESIQLRGVCAVPNEGFCAVSSNGGVLLSKDKGNTWEHKIVDKECTFMDVHFVDKLRGWLVGYSASKGVILATKDGGKEWNPPEELPESKIGALHAVHFWNKDRGCAVGANGTILKYTTSIGWTLQASGVGKNLWGISCAPWKAMELVPHVSRTVPGWAVGDSGTILVTRDHGESWSNALGLDLTISRGRMYVDGIVCELEQDITYLKQPDYPNPESLEWNKAYLIYFHVFHRHITALDDHRIREKALNGPDTTTRVKTVWQVRALPVWTDVPRKPYPTCSEEFPEWNELIRPSTGKLGASTKPPDTTEDSLCLVAARGGYRRLQNHLYRVEIHRGGELSESGGDVTFKWSRDNGSVVTSIESIDGEQITVADLGPDEALGFQKHQIVEVLDDEAELNCGSEPDWKPEDLFEIMDIDGLVITLNRTPVVDMNLNPKLRSWDQDKNSGTGAGVSATSGPIDLGEDGIQVWFSPGTYRSGDYWLIPARTATGGIEWPGYDPDDTTDPIMLPPVGIHHHFCRLALVYFSEKGLEIEDCRRLFPPLTDLSSTDEAIEITGTSWENDHEMTLDVFADGLKMWLSHRPHPVNDAAMIVTIELPIPNTLYYINSIWKGKLEVDPDQKWILWRPETDLLEDLDVILRRIGQARVRVTLKGHVIWTGDGKNRIYLDGQAFGSFDEEGHTILEFPSGAGAKASDFESWFYLKPQG